MNIKLFISFVISLLICLALNQLTFGQKANQELKSEHFWITKTHDSKKYDFVIIGDSRSLRGINPKLIENQGEGLNLSYPSAGLSKSYLDFALSKLKSNAKVFISITPFSFTDDAYQNKMLNQYLKMSVDEVFWKSNWTLLKSFSRISTSKFKEKSPKLKKIFHENGFVETHHFKIDELSGVVSYIKNFTKESYDFEKVKTFFDYLESKVDSKRVFTFRMPIYERVKKVEDELGKFDEKALKALIEKKGITWIGIDGKYQTYDGSHLTAKEAIRFSKKLNQIINELL